MDKVAWWDETHRKVVVGSLKKHCVRFKRDKDGKVDLTTGQFRDKKYDMKMKYPGETRLCLGVLGNRTLPAFDYTCRKIVSSKDYAKRIANQIAWARVGQGWPSRWREGGRVRQTARAPFQGGGWPRFRFTRKNLGFCRLLAPTTSSVIGRIARSVINLPNDH